MGFPYILNPPRSIVSDWKHFSNTDLSDLNIVGICDIFVDLYQMRHKVM